MATPVTLPKVGLTMTQGTISSWERPDGAQVAPGEVLFLMGTDKTETDVEAEAGGTLHHRAPAGTAAPPGTVVGWIVAPGEAPPPPATEPDAPTGSASASPSAAAPGPGAPEPAAPIPAAPTATGSPTRIVASPLARRQAGQLGIDLRAIRGTGPGGRIVAADLASAPHPTPPTPTPPGADPTPGPLGGPASPLAAALAARLGLDLATVPGRGPGGRIDLDDVVAAAPARATGPTPVGARLGDHIPMSPTRRVIAQRMQASLAEMAQLTLTREVAADALADLRAELAATWPDHGWPVPSFTDLLVRASALALRRHPLLNSSLVDGTVVVHPAVHVGMAVAVDGGLLVPVLRDADSTPLPELARRARQLAEATRNGQLGPDQQHGATFTVSSLGGSGIDAFTPIVNPPNVAILGVGRIRDGVTWTEAGAAPSRSLVLSLTIDHRVVDGAPGADFLATVADLVARPLALLGS